MPIKRRTPDNPSIPRPAAPKAAPKQPIKKAAAKKAAVKKPARVAAKKAPAKKPKIDMGPQLYPDTLPGANEAAQSLLGKILQAKVKFDGSGSNTFFFEFVEGTPKAENGWLWRQCGAAVVFESKNRFARYTGRLHGDEWKGEGKNSDGTTWEWTAQPTDATKKSSDKFYLDPDYTPNR